MITKEQQEFWKKLTAIPSCKNCKHSDYNKDRPECHYKSGCYGAPPLSQRLIERGWAKTGWELE